MIPEKRGDQEIKTEEEEKAMGKVCPYSRSGRAVVGLHPPLPKEHKASLSEFSS